MNIKEKLNKLLENIPQAILSAKKHNIRIIEYEDATLVLDYIKTESPYSRGALLQMAHILTGGKYITKLNDKYYIGALNCLKEYNIYSAINSENKIKLSEIFIKETKIKEAAKQHEYDKAITEFKKFNEGIKDTVPPNFEKFIYQYVLPNYALYRNKLKTAVCTFCNQSFPITKLKRKQETICPHCHTKLTALPEGHFSANNYEFTVKFEKHDKYILLRYYKAVQILNTQRRYRHFYETRRDFINIEDNLVETYIYENYKQSNYLGFIPEKFAKNPYNYYGYRDYWIYPSKIWPESKRVLKGTPYQYLFWKGQLPKVKENIEKNVTSYFTTMREYPFFETYLKIGRLDIIKSIMSDLDNVKKFVTEPSKALGIPRDILRMFPAQVNETFIWAVQFLIAENMPFNPTILKWINNINNPTFYLTKIKTLGLNFERTINYIDSQASEKNCNIYNGVILRDYLDYLENIRKLGIKMSKSILLPKDLTQAHNEAYTAIKLQKSKPYNKKFLEVAQKSKFKEMNINGLIIRLPHSAKEVILEGIQQHNCVESYLKSIVEEKTNVLFGRREEEPDKSYITIEINEDKVIQARYNHNQNCEPAVYNTIKKYIQLINEEAAKRKTTRRRTANPKAA